MVECEGCLRSSILVHFLVLMFGAGAWIAVNGVWVELPLIVSFAPESWNLPSYLTVIAQVANVGPVLVTLMQIFCPSKFHQNAMIYSILVLGTTSCLLLSFFWNTITVINGTPHSLALFILWFVLAFVDCTSSVTFLPFMTTFQTIFLTTYFVGEGLSGFLPSIFALMQGTQEYECINKTIINSTTNTSSNELQPEFTPPRYSTEIFFILLCIMMLACSVSFILLNFLGVARKFYCLTKLHPKGLNVEDKNCYYNSVEMQDSNESQVDKLDTTVPRNSESDQPVPTNEQGETLQPNAEIARLTKKEYLYFLSIIAFINAASNGVLPAVSSYTSLPYGSTAYHLSACLGNMANPVACLIAVFLPMHSYFGIGLFTVFSAGFGSYLMFLAVESPCPVFVYEDIGKALMILAQVFFVGCVSFVKVSIAQVFRKRGHPRSLVWYGATVQAGSLVGAVIMFPLVNVSKLFISGIPCKTHCL